MVYLDKAIFTISKSDQSNYMHHLSSGSVYRLGSPINESTVRVLAALAGCGDESVVTGKHPPSRAESLGLKYLRSRT
jgi:hypothetical protein